jgi:hypothetical protein
MFCGIVDGSFIADKLRLASGGCFSAEIAESKTGWVDGNGLLKSRMIVTESPQLTVSNNLFANSLGSRMHPWEEGVSAMYPLWRATPSHVSLIINGMGALS